MRAALGVSQMVPPPTRMTTARSHNHGDGADGTWYLVRSTVAPAASQLTVCHLPPGSRVCSHGRIDIGVV
eukprot:scaffold3084_cov144-Cylindrotheca_fusiformis.AAC.32